jgi:hypothetical protein
LLDVSPGAMKRKLNILYRKFAHSGHSGFGGAGSFTALVLWVRDHRHLFEHTVSRIA